MLKFSDDPRDLSNCKTLHEFLSRLSEIILRLAALLTKDGKIIVLIGNMRRNGRYYPLGSMLEVLFLHELRDELIKIQHHTRSQSFRYNGTFIPILHEKILILSGFKSKTWHELLVDALRQLGGHATLKEIYQQLQNHPKVADNSTWQATIRRECQEHGQPQGRVRSQLKQ